MHVYELFSAVDSYTVSSEVGIYGSTIINVFFMQKNQISLPCLL